MEESGAVNDVGLETRGELLVAEDLAFGVVPLVRGAVEEGGRRERRQSATEYRLDDRRKRCRTTSKFSKLTRSDRNA